MRKITPKQERFVEEFLKDLNATQAAIRTGYSPKTANREGTRLLSNAVIAAAIAEAKKARSERTGVETDNVVRELARLGFSDLRKVFTADGQLKPPSEWDDDTAAAIASIEVVVKPGGFDEDGNREVEHVHKIKLWDKNSALEKLGKHLKMFIERHEHDVSAPLAQLFRDICGKAFRPGDGAE